MPLRFNWIQKHPLACTCKGCSDRRLAKFESDHEHGCSCPQCSPAKEDERSTTTKPKGERQLSKPIDNPRKSEKSRDNEYRKSRRQLEAFREQREKVRKYQGTPKTDHQKEESSQTEPEFNLDDASLDRMVSEAISEAEGLVESPRGENVRESGHLENCSCYKCTGRRYEYRDGIPMLRKGFTGFRLKQLLRFVTRCVSYTVKTSVAVIFISVFVVLAIHIINTGSVGPSFRMLGNDFRVISSCPTSYTEISNFIVRDLKKSVYYGGASIVGKDIASIACNGEEGLNINLRGLPH